MLRVLTTGTPEPDASPPPGLKVGYVLKRFPRLSETFVLNEILELERQGVQVEIFSLLRPPVEPRHELLGGLGAPVTYLSGLMSATAKTAEPQSQVEAPVPELLSLLAGEEAAFAGLLPGKTAKQICKLHGKATAVALLAQTRGVDHLHAHFGSDATLVALLAGRLSGLTFSFTAHARDIYHTYVDAEADARRRRLKIAEAAFVATVSEYNRRYLADLAGAAREGKIKRVYNGVDLGRFRSTESAREPGLFLAVGRLIEKKGFADLLDACGILKAAGHEFRCRIVGDGPLKDDLIRRISAQGLGDRVALLGAKPQEDLIALLRTASAMVLPSRVSACGDRDGLPTVLLEALASGLPAVSTTVSGIPEIIDHERSGLLVPSEHPRRLAQAMERLLQDSRLRERLGRAGRLKAERDFDLGKTVAQLRGHFVEAIVGRISNLEGQSGEGRLRHG